MKFERGHADDDDYDDHHHEKFYKEFKSKVAVGDDEEDHFDIPEDRPPQKEYDN